MRHEQRATIRSTIASQLKALPPRAEKMRRVVVLVISHICAPPCTESCGGPSGRRKSQRARGSSFSSCPPSTPAASSLMTGCEHRPTRRRPHWIPSEPPPSPRAPSSYPPTPRSGSGTTRDTTKRGCRFNICLPLSALTRRWFNPFVFSAVKPYCKSINVHTQTNRRPLPRRQGVAGGFRGEPIAAILGVD